MTVEEEVGSKETREMHCQRGCGAQKYSLPEPTMIRYFIGAGILLFFARPT